MSWLLDKGTTFDILFILLFESNITAILISIALFQPLDASRLDIMNFKGVRSHYCYLLIVLLFVTLTIFTS